MTPDKITENSFPPDTVSGTSVRGSNITKISLSQTLHTDFDDIVTCPNAHTVWLGKRPRATAAMPKKKKKKVK